MKQQEQQTSVTIFYSYAETDQVLRDQLATHLSQLKRDGLIEEWYDQQILAGSDRTKVINQAIHSAHIILLFISADFLASDTCYLDEMKQALERHKRGDARVIPVLVRPCDWRHSPFAHLQWLPRNGQPITSWHDQDEALATIARELRRILEKQQFPPPLLSNKQQQTREQLLKRVQATWIEGLPEPSLHRVTRIDLHLQEQPDALDNPWQMIVQELDHAPRPLPVGTSIVEVYDKADGELLILGEPGSGKTTLLLELTRDLLDRAQLDSTLPMPVVFNLSSWAVKRLPIAEWLLEELNLKYRVPRKLGKRWIDQDQVLPLLDGLDEVVLAYRAACVEAINTYRQEHGSVPTVVCSRSADYSAQMARLQLQRAVVVQPPTAQQVNEYLEDAGPHLEELRVARLKDPVLQELTTTPLMLSVLTHTYHDTPLKDLLTSGSLETRRRQIFETYVQQMLMRRGVNIRYTPEQTVRWLAWLAQQMTKYSQTEFYLERMQPDWLKERLSLRGFYEVAVRVSTGLVGGLVSGLIGGLFGELIGGLLIVLGLWTVLGPTGNLIAGLPLGLVSGLLVGLLGGLTYRGEREIKPAEVVLWSWESIWQKLVQTTALRSGLIGGLVFGLLSKLVFGLNDYGLVLFFGLLYGLVLGLVGMTISQSLSGTQDKHREGQEFRYPVRNKVFVGLIGGLVVGLFVGLLVGLFFGLFLGPFEGLVLGLRYGLLGGLVAGSILGLMYRIREEVTPGEIMNLLRVGIWGELTKSETVKNMLVFGMLMGLFLSLREGLLFGVLGGLVSVLVVGLFFGLLSGVVFVLISRLFGGLSSDLLEKQLLTKPNQGIRHSARNSLRFGLLGGLVSGLVFGLLSGLTLGPDYRLALGFGLFSGLVFGLLCGLSIGLSNGGFACIQHAVLRIFLWRAGYTPWDYGYFLDYAAERILLRKIGGGYIFMHQMFMEHFAALPTIPWPYRATRQKERTLQTMNPPKSPARVVWVYGTIAGICLGTILLPLLFLLAGFVPIILAIVLAIVVFLLVGILAAKRTGRVDTGTLAGLVTGLTSGVMFGIFCSVFLLTVRREELTALLMSLNNNLDPDQAVRAIIFGLAVMDVAVMLVLLGFGAGIGMLGGLIGKRKSRMPPIG